MEEENNKKKREVKKKTHKVKVSDNGGRCTSNIWGYFGTKPLSAPLNTVLWPFSGASDRYI